MRMHLKEICFKNYEINQKDELYKFIFYSKSAVRVSGDVFAHHQEHLTVFTVPGGVRPICKACVTRLTSHIVPFQIIRDTSRQQIG